VELYESVELLAIGHILSDLLMDKKDSLYRRTMSQLAFLEKNKIVKSKPYADAQGRGFGRKRMYFVDYDGLFEEYLNHLATHHRPIDAETKNILKRIFQETAAGVFMTQRGSGSGRFAINNLSEFFLCLDRIFPAVFYEIHAGKEFPAQAIEQGKRYFLESPVRLARQIAANLSNEKGEPRSLDNKTKILNLKGEWGEFWKDAQKGSEKNSR